MRPETLIVEPGLQEGQNVLSGTVERITFEGSTVRYEIRLPNDETVIAVKPTLSGELLKAGETVRVFLPVEYTHVFPYPEAGLKGELSVA